jgi:copper chaperone CopZ
MRSVGSLVTVAGYVIPSGGIVEAGVGTVSETVVYRVPGMTCEHCKSAVAEELSALPGVESVAVDLDAKLVEVTGRSLDDAALRAAIDEAGYEAE